MEIHPDMTEKLFTGTLSLDKNQNYHGEIFPKVSERMSYSKDPDQTASQGQSDLGLHCLISLNCLVQNLGSL